MNLTGSKWVDIGKRVVLRDRRGKTLAQVEDIFPAPLNYRASLFAGGKWHPVGDSLYLDIAQMKAERALEALP